MDVSWLVKWFSLVFVDHLVVLAGTCYTVRILMSARLVIYAHECLRVLTVFVVKSTCEYLFVAENVLEINDFKFFRCFPVFSDVFAVRCFRIFLG